MAYTTGSAITAADYNSFYNDVKDIYGDSNSNATSDASLIFGYGESMLGATVSAGNTITAAHWNNLVKMIHRCADHQGTSITLAGGANTDAVSAGDTISPIANLASSITSIRTNKLNASAGNLTTDSQDSATYSNAWAGGIVRTHTLTWASYNDLRYFFNQGGKIQHSFSTANSSGSAQDAEWADLITKTGTITFDINSIARSGSIAINTSASGFTAINGSTAEQVIFKAFADSSPYTGNFVQVSYTLNSATTPSAITVKTKFTDAHSAQTGTFTGGGLGSAPNEGTGWTGADSVTIDITSTTSTVRANGTYINSTAPTASGAAWTGS